MNDDANIAERAVQRIKDAQGVIELALADLRATLPEVKKKRLGVVLAEFFSLRNAYEAMEESRKQIGAEIDNLSKGTIPEMMAEEDTKSQTLELAGLRWRFTVNQRASCSMPDKDKGMNWLKDNGHGDLIQPTVNAQTLSSFAKNYLEQTGMDLPTDLFKVSTSPYTSITKA
jgi:hypothetical protein